MTSVGGSVGQLPLVEVPSPKSIDQLAMSPSGSLLLVPRKVKLNAGKGGFVGEPDHAAGRRRRYCVTSTDMS